MVKNYKKKIKKNAMFLVDKLKKTSTIIITIEEKFNLSTKIQTFIRKMFIIICKEN